MYLLNYYISLQKLRFFFFFFNYSKPITNYNNILLYNINYYLVKSKKITFYFLILVKFEKSTWSTFSIDRPLIILRRFLGNY